MFGESGFGTTAFGEAPVTDSGGAIPAPSGGTGQLLMLYVKRLLPLALFLRSL